MTTRESVLARGSVRLLHTQSNTMVADWGGPHLGPEEGDKFVLWLHRHENGIRQAQLMRLLNRVTLTTADVMSVEAAAELAERMSGKLNELRNIIEE